MAGYRAKKRLGQNFLKSPEIIERIVDLIVKEPDLPVIEIGPGRGSLTLPLAERGFEVLAVEFDRDLIGYLKKLVKSFPKVTIVNADFLELEPDTKTHATFLLVGNIPYNLTSPVLDWCVKYRRRLCRVVLMVQGELANRICSHPGSRDWSPLAIMTQLHFGIKRCFEVPPGAFKPVPQVASAVIELTPVVQESADPEGIVSLERVVRAAFGQRRKLLVNNLVPAIIPDSALAGQVLSDLSLSGNCRAEELSIDQFLKLTDYLVSHNILKND